MPGRVAPVAASDTVLARMAGFLTLLSQDVENVAACLSEMTTGDGVTMDRAQMTQLQRLDYIQQALEDLARMSQILSADYDSGEQDLAQLRLAATRAIVFAESLKTPRQAPGTIELF